MDMSICRESVCMADDVDNHTRTYTIVDCSIAYGHINPAKTAQIAVIIPTAINFQNVCFNRKLNAVRSISTRTTVSII